MTPRLLAWLATFGLLALGLAGLAAGDDVSVTVTAQDQLRFVPDSITVTEGDVVTVTVVNAGVIGHTFTIDELGVNLQLATGETRNVTFTADQAGTYAYYCAVGGHRAGGMEGSLVVESPAQPSTPGFEGIVALVILGGVALVLRASRRA